LANFFVAHGHHVTLLVGEQATYRGDPRAQRVETFTTATDLREHLRTLCSERVDAVFHAAAVSDFAFGKIWRRSPQGDLTEIKSDKISTRDGTLLAELLPTPKIIAGLRDWFPKARLVGWKYEVDGDRTGVIRLAEEQIRECRTDACVANGPAYGNGFGLVTLGRCVHRENVHALFAGLEEFIRK
jgi:phosphopantothenoylcysteine decarboxylase/phosphopantothenate--cysteine ligase